MGIATENAFYGADPINPKPRNMRKEARFSNMKSESNGSLMRITPLAVWCVNMHQHPNLVAKSVMEDVVLSHPNYNCIQAAICYVLAIVYLLNNPQQRLLAYEYVKYILCIMYI